MQKAFLGNNASLGRLGVGLTKAELTTSTFLQIQERLTELFAGQAKSAADGYLGSINKLTIASNNAKEIIGKDLIDSLALLSGPIGISKSTAQMEELAKAIGDTVYGLALLIKTVKEIPGASFIMSGFGEILTNLQPFAGLRNLGSSTRARNAGTPQQSPGQRKAIDKANSDALKLQKSKNALAVIDNANTTRKLVLTADQQALEELKKKFDVERIGLFSALNQATDEETRLRLKSLIAIYDNDAALALKIKAELEAAEAARLLALALAQSLTAWGNWQTLIGNSFAAAAMAATSPVAITPTPSMPSPSYAPGDIPGISGQRGFNFSGAGSGMQSVVVNVAGSVTTERDLVSAITQGIYNNQASGIPISYTTAFR